MKIIDDCPVSGNEEAISIPHGYHTLLAYQPVVTVCLSVEGRMIAPAFPAFVDPGHNHNFSISEQQLRDWLGIGIDALPALRMLRFRNEEVPLVAADVMLFRNKKGTREVNPKDPYQFTFATDKGITVHKRATAPLPILGLRGIMRRNLKLLFDGERKCFSIST